MLTEYPEKAMEHAAYEEMEESGFFGHIRELKGPWAKGDTKEECQANLGRVLEEWLVLARDRMTNLPDRRPELWRQLVGCSGRPRLPCPGGSVSHLVDVQ